MLCCDVVHRELLRRRAAGSQNEGTAGETQWTHVCCHVVRQYVPIFLQYVPDFSYSNATVLYCRYMTEKDIRQTIHAVCIKVRKKKLDDGSMDG